MKKNQDVLPDVIKPGLKVLFVGMAAGRVSKEVKAYYAGPGNKFWGIICKVGLTPHQLCPQEFRSLLDNDIGLTDLCKKQFGADEEITIDDEDRRKLIEKIAKNIPKIVAFNGKKAAKRFLNIPHIQYGFYNDIGPSKSFVLPSTSAAANRYWDESPWWELAKRVGNSIDGR